MNGRRTTMQVARLAGVSYRQLDHWCRRGYLHPDAIGGSGNVRLWTPAETVLAVRLAELVRSGYTVSAAAALVREKEEVTS